jgi:hypothetical protein
VILRFVLWNLADSKRTIQRHVNEQLSRLGLAFE